MVPTSTPFFVRDCWFLQWCHPVVSFLFCYLLFSTAGQVMNVISHMNFSFCFSKLCGIKKYVYILNKNKWKLLIKTWIIIASTSSKFFTWISIKLLCYLKQESKKQFPMELVWILQKIIWLGNECPNVWAPWPISVDKFTSGYLRLKHNFLYSYPGAMCHQHRF